MQSEREQQAARLESMGEVMAKSYSSWLSWWKNVMNTDDYMKYISAQVYFSVVFRRCHPSRNRAEIPHFYIVSAFMLERPAFSLYFERENPLKIDKI